MDARPTLRSTVPSPNEILVGPVALAIEADSSVAERSAASGVRVFDRSDTLVRGQAEVSNAGHRIEWRPARPLPPGAYRLTVEELSTPDGKRIWDRLDVPFAVISTTVPVPANLEVRAFRMATPAPLGVRSLRTGERVKPESFALIKAIDRRTGEALDLALDRNGEPVDVGAIERAAIETHAKAFGKMTPALAATLSGKRVAKRIKVAIWLADADEPDTDDRNGKLADIETNDRTARRDPLSAERSEKVAVAVSRFMEFIGKELGEDRSRSDRLAPVIYAELSADQIAVLAHREDVAAIFPYDPRGIDDLTNSLAIAEATAPQNAGTTGESVRVAVWEPGPDQTGSLDIEAFYDPSQSATSSHARMTHGIIKNTSANDPRGYAPDCDLYSANSYELDALGWAAGQGCTVISQSFHRDAEQTDSSLSFDDVYKDWLALRSPYPTIVQASGNGADTEFVNHKGFNGLTVGSHDDTASAMAGDSVFNNPASPHGDRELPEICANGTGVTVLGLTDSGTSFAAPAVAGAAALVQSANTVLRSWPEGTRAILLAGARRNVSDGRWWPDVSAGVDGSDGSGAMNARESVEIARHRGGRDATGAQRGFDLGRFHPSDFGNDRFLNWSYNLRVPPPTTPISFVLAWRAKAVLTWNGTIDKLPLLGIDIDFPIGSHLGLDVDLEVYDSRGGLVAGSWSYDNSYEIAEWTAAPGETYRIRPRRWSGGDESWFGVAWTAIPVFRPIFDSVRLETLAEIVAGG